MTRIVFVRHARSAPSPDLSEADWPLSEQGRAQARALIPVLQGLGVAVLASSPYPRAIETLRPFADTAGLPVALDDDLRERKLTDDWLPDVAAVEAAVRRMFAEPEFAFPGGESAVACLARFEAAVGRVAAANPGAVIAVGTHGGVLGHFMAAHRDGPPFEFWKSMRNPHLFVFDFTGAPTWVGEHTLDGAAAR